VNTPVKVLMIEDSEGDAKLTLRALKIGGFNVTHLRVQTAAAMKAGLEREPWDAIISDFQMPGFTGMDALNIFRSTGLDIPFILVSGTIGEEFAANAMKAGASDYVMKENLARLAPALERELKEAQDRAEHRLAQGALLDSEERFRQIAENIRDVFYLRDADSRRMLYVSPAYEEVWGRSCESLYANPQSWTDAIHPNDRAPASEKLKSGILAGKYEFTYRIVRPDGAIRLVKTRGYPVRDESGKIVRFAGVAEDITESSEAAQELKTSLEEFRTLAESMPQIVWITRPDGWNIYFNQKWMDYTGLTVEESLGHGWNKPFHPDDQQRAWDAWQHATSVIDTYSLEARLRRADGAYRWWLVRGTPLHDASGNITKWFGTCTDIHDLKVAQLEIASTNQVLRESERRFTDMLQNVELVSLMRDLQGRITYCNEYFLHLTGWSQEEVIGQNWVERFIPPEMVDEKRDVFKALLANSLEARHHEHEILTRSGERRLIRWNNSLLRSGAGDLVGTASIGEDITEQKRAEISIRRLNRVYAVLSGINTLLVRVQGRDELFQEACKIAVEAGEFLGAFVAMIESGSNELKVVASSNTDTQYLEKMRDVLSRGLTDPSIEVLTGRDRLFIQHQPFVLNNIESDLPRSLQGPSRITGAHGLCVLPLVIADQTIGVLALRARETGSFDAEEMKLLRELAGDIAFAMDTLEKRERLDYLAYYDVLTGLANRKLFLERLAQYMRVSVSSGFKIALFLFDLERFKNINDSLGWAAGDAILRQVAEWLTRNLGDANLFARTGADHFAIVLPEVKREGDVARLVEKTMKAFLDHPFRLNDAVFRIAAKVGVALFPDDGADADALFRNAEAALKKAKASGEQYLFYAQDMTESVGRKLTLENQLRQALERNEFVLHYQPKGSLASGKLTGAEALIRWNDPRSGLVPPGRFIPILEETGLIHDVGRWALRAAVAEYLRWSAAGLPTVRIAVNVSSQQLRSRNFIDDVREVIGVDPRAAGGLELEITESLLMEDLGRSIESLNALRALGITIAIDDFGTGFSSLAYLAQLPLDTLKIDITFVKGMAAGPEGLALVQTIISLGHALKLKIVAEGVETEEQSRLLRLLNCDEMQGFLFSKAVPAEDFEAKFLAPASLES